MSGWCHKQMSRDGSALSLCKHKLAPSCTNPCCLFITSSNDGYSHHELPRYATYKTNWPIQGTFRSDLKKTPLRVLFPVDVGPCKLRTSTSRQRRTMPTTPSLQIFLPCLAVSLGTKNPPHKRESPGSFFGIKLNAIRRRVNITSVIHSIYSIEFLQFPSIEIETFLFGDFGGCVSLHLVMKAWVLATVAVVWRGWGGLLRAVFRPLSVFVQGLWR